MGKVASTPNTRILLDQFDVSGFANSGDMGVEQELLDGRGFSTVGPLMLPANFDHNHSYNILFDGADDSTDEIVASLLGNDTDHYLSELFGANAENSVAYDSIVKLAREPIQAAKGALIVINASLAGAGHLVRGLVLRNATVTGTGQGTGRNQGATIAGQTYAAIVRVISGTFTSITVRIQQSSDDGGGDAYADISGMTTTLTAAGVARQTTIAATEAWKRVSVQAFAGTNAVIIVTAGLAAGT